MRLGMEWKTAYRLCKFFITKIRINVFCLLAFPPHHPMQPAFDALLSGLTNQSVCSKYTDQSQIFLVSTLLTLWQIIGFRQTRCSQRHCIHCVQSHEKYMATKACTPRQTRQCHTEKRGHTITPVSITCVWVRGMYLSVYEDQMSL